MKIPALACALLMTTALLPAETVIQTGFESYLGPNRMTLWTPWLGVRHTLSPASSLLVKCYFHNLEFRYINLDEQEAVRSAHLLNLTGAYYRQGPEHEYYGALSLFSGTEGYSGIALDAGVGFEALRGLTVDVGIYALNESSVLWQPEEPRRRVTTGSLKGGVRLKIFDWLRLNPRVHLYRNTDGVTASTLAAGLIIIPRDPLFISLAISKYSESAEYRYSGNYLEFSLNYYR